MYAIFIPCSRQNKGVGGGGDREREREASYQTCTTLPVVARTDILFGRGYCLGVRLTLQYKTAVSLGREHFL